MPYPRIFIGPKGAVTPLHMDIWRTHAWLSQLVGRKRWLIFPPSNDNEVYVYPFIHPSHAQCQVDVDQPDLNLFPNVKNSQAYEVILYPGDIFFLPNGWFHHVEALDKSISVNFWTYSIQNRLMKNLVDITLPYKSTWTQREKVEVGQLYLNQLLQSLGKPEDFIRKLVAARYQQLFNNKILESKLEICSISTTKKFSELADFSDVLTKVLEVLEQFPNHQDRDQWLRNYVEYVAAKYCVEITLVGAFLNTCF